MLKKAKAVPDLSGTAFKITFTAPSARERHNNEMSA